MKRSVLFIVAVVTIVVAVGLVITAQRVDSVRSELDRLAQKRSQTSFGLPEESEVTR